MPVLDDMGRMRTVELLRDGASVMVMVSRFLASGAGSPPQASFTVLASL